MRRCVWSRNLVNEEAMARFGPQRHRKKKNTIQPNERLLNFLIYSFQLHVSVLKSHLQGEHKIVFVFVNIYV